MMISVALAAALWIGAPELELASPQPRTGLRGEPAELEVALAVDQDWAEQLRVEVDGHVTGWFVPWLPYTTIELEPGLHRVAVLGVDRRDGQALRSATVQVAVFREAARKRLTPRQRNGWTAVVAFAVAIGGAGALRRRGR